MTEVMNRAGRRAAGLGKPAKQKLTVRVRNQIAVVPMEHLETYYAHEIASEGKWAAGRIPIIIRHSVDTGLAKSAWFPRTLDRMRETRRRKGTIPFRIVREGEGAMEFDVGLVDVTVFFQLPAGVPPSLPRTRQELDMAFTENLRHFDSVCAGALHDQMIVASVPHLFHSNGSPLLHYHNLVFGLRQEVRGEMDILGPLDMEPLLKALARSGPLNIIGGMTQ